MIQAIKTCHLLCALLPLLLGTASASALPDSAWDYFHGELHEPQPVWHPESNILRSSGLALNEAGYPIYIETLSHISPDGMTLTHRSREYFIGQPGTHNDTTHVQHAVSPFVFMDTLHSIVPPEAERVDFEIWDIDPATNRLKTITSKLYNFRDPSHCKESTTWTAPAPIPPDELANANAHNGFFIKVDEKGGFFLHRHHPDLFSSPDGKHMVQALSGGNVAANYEFIIYEKQEDGTWRELPDKPRITTDRAALDFSLESHGISVIIIDAEYEQAHAVFIPYHGKGADTDLGYRTSYTPREQQADAVKVEFLAVHPMSESLVTTPAARRTRGHDTPLAPGIQTQLAQPSLSGYQILPYPLTDELTGKPLLDKNGKPAMRYIIVQSQQAAQQQGVYLCNTDIATVETNPSRRDSLLFTLTPDAAQRMARLTAGMTHGSSRLAIVINGRVRCAPIVHGTLHDTFACTGLTEPGEPEAIAAALTAQHPTPTPTPAQSKE